MDFPRKYLPADAPAGLLALVDRLMPLLIAGDHPALAALREQFTRGRIKEVRLTGVGFYVDFEVPSGVPLTQPTDFAGGGATITLDCASHGAGCVLFVRGGRLATLEGFTYDEPWTQDAVISLSGTSAQSGRTKTFHTALRRQANRRERIA
jgi:hypothetical protein